MRTRRNSCDLCEIERSRRARGDGKYFTMLNESLYFNDATIRLATPMCANSQAAARTGTICLAASYVSSAGVCLRRHAGKATMASKSRILRSKEAEALSIRPEKGATFSGLRWLSALFGTKQEPVRPAAPTNPYHAVSVLPGTEACAAAYRFSGQRFLSKQAPRLPLPSCDAISCTCRFKHHKDRRAGPRRNSDVGIVTLGYAGRDRRQSRGRRATDRY